MARTQLALAGVSFLKGASEEAGGGGGGGGGGNKNKFEKLKANRSQSKERNFVPKCRRMNLLGVFAIIGPVQVGILKQFLRLLFLLWEGFGARGEGGVRSKV